VIGLTGGAAMAALLAGLAQAQVIAEPWRWPAWLLLAVALAAWSRRTRDVGLGWLSFAPIIVTGLAMAIGFEQLSAYAASIATDAATPPLSDLVEFEFIATAVLAKRAGFETMREVAVVDRRLDEKELERMIAQADKQHDWLASVRREVAAEVFGGHPGPADDAAGS